MATLAIAVGNPLRRDDGVAHAVLKRLDCESRSYLQLTPEVAEEIAGFDTVVFIDADACSAEVRIDPVDEEQSSSALSHFSSPAEVVALSKALFGFAGRAFLCRIPSADFSCRTGLTRRAKALATQAAEQLRVSLADGLGRNSALGR